MLSEHARSETENPCVEPRGRNKECASDTQPWKPPSIIYLSSKAKHSKEMAGEENNTGNLVFSDSQFSGGYKSTPHPQKREAQRCGLPECSSGDVSGLFEVWSSLFKFHQPVRVYSVWAHARLFFHHFEWKITSFCMQLLKVTVSQRPPSTHTRTHTPNNLRNESPLCSCMNLK